MANSKFEYVRLYEQDDRLLPGTFTVIRLDGRGFHKFTDKHHFTKPNDDAALRLMNACACATMIEMNDIVFAYGQSDEFSFVLKKTSSLYGRRSSKLISTVVSVFTSNYVFQWSKFFDTPLLYPPSFDGRAISYPDVKTLRDYLSWRQADCHINNLYNTCFWALVHAGKTPAEAEETLRGTLSGQKNEILFSQFNVNYNNIPEIYRKGSILYVSSILNNGKNPKNILTEHCDIIQDTFWKDKSYLLD